VSRPESGRRRNWAHDLGRRGGGARSVGFDEVDAKAATGDTAGQNHLIHSRRISDFGLKIGVFNPQSEIRNPKSQANRIK
jgi:hypothetical protein